MQDVLDDVLRCLLLSIVVHFTHHQVLASIYYHIHYIQFKAEGRIYKLERTLTWHSELLIMRQNHICQSRALSIVHSCLKSLYACSTELFCV